VTEMLDPVDISESEVVSYLQTHAHFFEDHPNLLKRLHLKHDSGRAISLIERQNHILRKENTDLIDRLNQFINVAQRNDRLFINLQALVIDLVSTCDLNDVCQVLQQGLTERFEVDDVQMVLFDQPVQDGDLWLDGKLESFQEHFPATSIDGRNMCGEFDPSSRALLFNGGNIKSIALGALKVEGKSIGLIALGSTSSRHFRSGTDTLFLGHLAEVVSRLIHRLA